MDSFDAFMKDLPAINQIAGTGLSAYGNWAAAGAAERAGERQRIQDEFQAAQLTQSAGQVFAAAQRAQEEQTRQATLVQSRILAIAAAGGGALDSTVVNLIARTAGEGVYRGNVALYKGEEEQRQLMLQAAGKVLSGQAAVDSAAARAGAYRAQAFAKIGSGAAGFYGSSLRARYASSANADTGTAPAEDALVP